MVRKKGVTNPLVVPLVDPLPTPLIAPLVAITTNCQHKSPGKSGNLVAAWSAMFVFLSFVFCLFAFFFFFFFFFFSVGAGRATVPA